MNGRTPQMHCSIRETVQNQPGVRVFTQFFYFSRKFFVYLFREVFFPQDHRIRFMEMPEEQKQKFLVRGVSVHSVEDARLAEQCGATYLTAGHVFVTDCKKGLAPRGLDFLHEVCSSVKIPVYAIGGINDKNAASCIREGAAGVCVMSGYMRMR